MNGDLKEAALEYHRFPTAGKISVTPTKSMVTQRDLALAYSPGVAEACLAIVDNPDQADDLTSRSNLIAVVTNGTAVLGLGNIGPLAGKPVMEGKGCLFKKFAGIDVFDIELAENDPDKLVETIARLEPTFGGINLEDIKAPECFYIEKKLRERMKIPVFHDDQHGTAIVAAAALVNGLALVGKTIADVKLVCSGAGAAAIACIDLAVRLGLDPKKVLIVDRSGVVYAGRPGTIDESKARYANDTSARTLADAIAGADIFLGLSAAGVLTPDMVKTMAPDPLIFAMANPDPEIRPEDAIAARPDAIIGTGRSDYPNQINNVLCFPFIFRGALDCGATAINEEMKVAAVNAIAELAHAEAADAVAAAYKGAELRFGREYLIPKPFDPRLIAVVAPAVARAAADSGVARRPIADLEAYRQKLDALVYHSGQAMQPVFARAKRAERSVILAEGEDERVLRAAQIIVDEKIATPVAAWPPRRHRQENRGAPPQAGAGPGRSRHRSPGSPDHYGGGGSLLRSQKARRRFARAGAVADAGEQFAARGLAPRARRRRRDAMRRVRPGVRSSGRNPRRDRLAPRRAYARRHADAAAAASSAVHLRHPLQRRSGRGANHGNCAAGGRGGAAVSA